MEHYPKSTKKNQKIDQMDLETLGFWLIMPENVTGTTSSSGALNLHSMTR